MKVKSFLTGRVYEAEWRSEKQPWSSHEQPALVLIKTGEAVDAAFFEVMKEPEREGE